MKEHGKVITSRYDWGELIDLDEYNNVKSEYDIEKIRETYGNVDNKPDEYLSMKNEINQRCYELEDEITDEDKDRIEGIVSGYIFEKFDKNSGLLGSVASTYFWLDAIFGERYIEIKRLSELNNYKEYLETFDNYTSTFKIIDIFKEMDKQKDSDYFTTIHDAFGWYGDIKGRYMIASECGFIPHIIVLLLALKAKQACEHMG